MWHCLRREAPSSFEPDPIADAGLREQLAWSRDIALEFISQLRHLDPYIVSVLDRVRSPYLFQELALRQHLARMADQHLEQLVLGGG